MKCKKNLPIHTNGLGKTEFIINTMKAANNFLGFQKMQAQTKCDDKNIY